MEVTISRRGGVPKQIVDQYLTEYFHSQRIPVQLRRISYNNIGEDGTEIFMYSVEPLMMGILLTREQIENSLPPGYQLVGEEETDERDFVEGDYRFLPADN